MNALSPLFFPTAAVTGDVQKNDIYNTLLPIGTVAMDMKAMHKYC